MSPTILSGTIMTSEAGMEANISLPLTDITPLEPAKGFFKDGFLLSGPGEKVDRCHLFHRLTFSIKN